MTRRVMARRTKQSRASAIRFSCSQKSSLLHPPLLALVSVAFLLALPISGCKSHSHTSDPRLQKIDELLNTQLPPGTPRPRVQFFLNSRGFALQDSPDKTAIVALVRHVDPDTLQPATALATFHFDAQSKLVSYDLQATQDAPLRQ